jgi:hypothetical protein
MTVKGGNIMVKATWTAHASMPQDKSNVRSGYDLVVASLALSLNVVAFVTYFRQPQVGMKEKPVGLLATIMQKGTIYCRTIVVSCSRQKQT